jgi:hypothetical protein
MGQGPHCQIMKRLQTGPCVLPSSICKREVSVWDINEECVATDGWLVKWFKLKSVAQLAHAFQHTEKKLKLKPKL